MVRIGWWVIGLEALGLIYVLIRVATEKSYSPESGKGLGIFAAFFMMVLLGGAAGMLYFFSRRGSSAGIVAVLLVLIYPLIVLVAQPVVIGLKKYRENSEENARGDFRNPALKAMAKLILSNDAEGLKKALNGQPPPDENDAAGEDLLGFALFRLRDRQGSLDCVRAIVETGPDLKKPRRIDGRPFLHFILADSREPQQEAARLLIQRGADPNAVDPEDDGDTPLRLAAGNLETVKALVEAGANIDYVSRDGLPAVVHMTMTRQWGSALYLVESGARLDIANEDGVSLDYYLKDWKDGVFGEQIEGWDRLRAAIQKRRR